jgi:SAM-dependent methyltransferase
MNIGKRIKEGWQISAQGYSDLIRDELNNNKRDTWTKLILEYAPFEGKMNILDVGTGPGFFAIILTLAGHNVVGIDITEEMIQRAKVNAQREGVSPEFIVMDSENLAFDEETFDIVISRNVVWTLTRPQDAYREWLRVLKIGGRLLVFDADWLRDCRDPGFKTELEKDKAEYTKLYGSPRVSYNDYKKARGWRINLSLASEKRPEWDHKILKELGYQNINSTFISERVYNQSKLLLYRSLPMFMIRADKIK